MHAFPGIPVRDSGSARISPAAGPNLKCLSRRPSASDSARRRQAGPCRWVAWPSCRARAGQGLGRAVRPSLPDSPCHFSTGISRPSPGPPAHPPSRGLPAWQRVPLDRRNRRDSAVAAVKRLRGVPGACAAFPALDGGVQYGGKRASVVADMPPCRQHPCSKSLCQAPALVAHPHSTLQHHKGCFCRARCGLWPLRCRRLPWLSSIRNEGSLQIILYTPLMISNF